MATHQEVLGRLRNEPAHLQALVDLAIDHALDRPLKTALDPAALASTVGAGLRAMAEAPGLHDWLVARAQASLKGLDELEGPLGERIPITALAPMEKILAREIVPDPDLVRALMDHPSLRELMREVLTANLLEFGRRIGDLLPGGGGKGGRGMGLLGAVAKNMASGVSGAIEKQIEERARGFVEDALGIAVDSTIERFCDPKQAGEMARWRVDVFRALLTQPVEHLLDERRKYPPKAFATDAEALIKAFAGWSQLDEHLEAAAHKLLAHHGDQTARGWLEGSGLEAGVREQVREQLVREAQALVGDEMFGDWLAELMA